MGMLPIPIPKVLIYTNFRVSSIGLIKQIDSLLTFKVTENPEKNDSCKHQQINLLFVAQRRKIMPPAGFEPTNSILPGWYRYYATTAREHPGPA